MTPYLIIDGYNLMHAAGIARRSYGPGDMERCRVRMNRELVALLSPEVLAQAVIVYDAFASISDDNREQHVDGLMVLYAPQGTDADSEIERLLLQHSVPKRILVVSGDHRLHKAAGRRRARCVDSEEFWDSLHEGVDGVVSPKRDADSTAVSENAVTCSAPDDQVVDDLQRWASEAERTANSGEDNGRPVFEAFDEDYLRRLDEDINRGRIG